MNKTSLSTGKFLRYARRTLLGAAIFGTLVFGVNLVENWRGSRAWKACVAERLAAGEQLQVLPSPSVLPDAHNFMKTPLLDRWLFADPKTSDYAKYAQAFPLSPFSKNDYKVGIRFSPERFFKIAGAKLGYAAGQPASPGVDDVLVALKPVDSILEELRLAVSNRPDSELVRPRRLDSAHPFEGPIARFQVFRPIVTTLAIHASASLGKGDSTTALYDSLASLRLARGMYSAPDSFLIDAMVGVVGTGMSLQPIWEGTRFHLFDDAQLLSLQKELALMKPLSGLARSLQVERNCALSTIDHSHPGDLLAGAIIPRPKWGHWTHFVWIPRGVLLQNKVNLVRLTQPTLDFLDTLRKREGTAVSGASAAFERTMNEKIGVPNPYTIFVAMAVPAYSKVIDATIRTQAYLDMAQIACALERYRLLHASYPTSLESLVPAFLVELPKDIADGQPLRYQVTPEGSYMLYSVGLDGTDENGRLDEKTDQGDWAWALPVELPSVNQAN